MAKFVSSRDFEFFQHINKEISAEIIDTLVVLYKLNLDYVNTNIYGESTEKISYTGIELSAFIDYGPNQAVSDSGFGIDQTQEVEFRFVRSILEERHVYPEIGDIVGYNDAFYEINNTREVQLIAGRPGYNESIICETHLTRRSNIQIEPRQI
tara:strand:+ start:267 stop:725 length:459 start_codon:yes stop_codon:yes gene_type:complete